ncbi:hypothetical protein IT157_02045 [bacterium]|nr:hypothetical protein [bacterium]
MATVSDNFGVSLVEFYYRHTGDPSSWTSFGADNNWPYSVNWTVPTDLVVGWTYEFAAVGWDHCNQTEFSFDWSAAVVDEEANISIYAINDYYDVEGTPHVNGTQICIYAESEPNLDYVRFIYVSAEGDTTEIHTTQGPIGQTDWSSCGNYWDVTTLPEGPAQICAIGSADLGGELVTMATDCRNIIIDHSLPYSQDGELPSSHGLLGGYCSLVSVPENEPDDIWVHFNNQLTDAGLDTVWFEWKWAESPNDPEFWYNVGYAYQDNGLTGNWVYSWDVYTYFTTDWDGCGTISLRAVLSDNAIPTSNLAYVLFADTVRVDNCPPDVQFTNVNGDLTPDGTVIPWGEIINIVATAEDVFGMGGNSNIDSVCFYGDDNDASDLIWCDTEGPLWSTQLATSSIPPNSTYNLRVIAWDEAGNCNEHTISVYIEDSQYQRACIVGFDDDNEFGCDDYIYAVTDDCDPNWTSAVNFQISTDLGQTWIPLDDWDESPEPQCNDWLGWNLWRVTLEFNLYPANAWFRAVARDESNNVDPNPPVWRRNDVTTTDETQIWVADWVRVPSNGQEQPWVLTTLEDYTENCLIEAGLVCIEPEAGSTYYAGEMPTNTRACELEDEDGRITVFTSNKVTEGDLTFVEMVTYSVDIHEANYQGGSNGTLVSEDGALEVTIPTWGTGWRGSLWFQPYLPSHAHDMVPAYQYYYTLLSAVEEVQSDDLEELDIVTPECSFRMHFDNSLLPENAEEWQVVVAYWNWDMSDYSGMYEGGWQEFGITYNDRDLENGTVDFQWMPDWDISDVTSVCPDRVRFGVFLTTIRPIDEFVRMNSGADCNPWFENPVYNGLPVVDCTPNWWVVLGEGEFPPEPERVDVWLDGIRIVNDGEAVMLEGYDYYDDCDYYDYYDEIFSIEYDDVSGIFSVEMTSNYGNCPPWFGCLMHGIHTIQFYVDDRPTNVTEFFVDNTDPMAHSEPGWINQQITLWADLEDRESGIDTGFVELDLKNCLDLTGILEYNLSSEAMTFTPLMDGDQQIGVHAEVTVQFDDIRFLFDVDTIIQGEFEICLNQLCAEWNVYNNTCLANHESHYYTYTVDEQPPVTYIISPRGAGIDDDGDGSVNEDPRDGINNDNDRFWGNGGWEARIDEDPINFVADTFNCGERPVISSTIDDIERWCSGASGLDLSTWHILVDEHEYTAADTNNTALAMSFTTGPTNLTFVMGGDGAGELADAWYEPGSHTIQVWVSDLVGNQGSNGNDPDFAWTYYVECPGPAVEFHDTEAGNWFNPEFQPGHPREFGFTVTTTSGAAIAPNGITYTAVTVPDNFPLAATTVDPAGQDEVEVTFTLDGSFPDGQTGINITVETRNIFAISGDDNGPNTSSRTYWADGCEPMEVTHIPATDAEVGNEGNVVVEVQYNDDCGGALFNVGGNVSLTKNSDGALSVNNSKNALTKNSITSRNGDGALDDNGSGINVERVWFVVVPPRGDVMRFEELEDFIELTTSSAKIMLTDPISGLWTVNAYAEDRVANLATWTWTFRVLSTGPVIDLSYSTEGTCQYNGFWNPNYPLWFEGTVTENDGANVRNGDISVHFYGLYDCDGQICEQELTGNLTLDISPAYDNSNVEQTFTLGGQATFGDFDGYGTPTDLRVELTACDQFGVCQTIEQTYVVDATAPNIEIISPLANSVISDVNLVTISAHIWDDEDGGAFTMPGGNETLMDKNAAQVTGVFGGTNLKGQKTADTYNVTKFELGSWKDAITRSFNNSLDGNSGVDPECVELRLINHTTGTSTNLTEEASFNAGILTWTGGLECASYTVVVSACDHTCNTSSEVWSFVVTCETPGDGIQFLAPYHVSAMPHCFKALVTDEMIDRGTLRLNLEGGMMVDGNLVWAPIVVDAPVNFNGDTAIYCANFDLSGLANIRASLGGFYNGGIAFPSVTQVYTVDTGAPVFTAVQPDPSVILGILTDPEFRVDFAEVGTTGLDPASVRFWLTTAGGTTVANEPTVSIAPNGLTGYATLRPEPLASGDYVLHADLSDIAGNHASMTWAYQVGADLPIPTDVIHNFPNPFTKEDGHTTFVLFAPGSGAGADVEIKIYDVAGHFVKTVIDGIVADPGLPITWDGTNEKDEEVANGVYLAYVNINGGGGESKQSIVKVAYKKEAK